MNSSDPAAPAAHASSKFVWPPVIYGTATIVSLLLAWRMPLIFVSDAALFPRRLVGIAVVILGMLMIVGAARLFRRAGTPVAPTEPTSALVTDGIYRWTRNPMYLALSLILLGIALATGSLWFFIGLAVAIFAVTKLAIEKEEIYLADKFGASYLDYKAHVRRWI
jgi:protein-S-isoprenylcysteine O-methyltransferase Ste14